MSNQDESHERNDAEPTDSNMEVDDKMAYQGIQLMLNNKINDSYALFQKHRKTSIQMYAGYSLVTFMHALMTFEDNNLKMSEKLLQETEKQCSQEIAVLKTMKPRDKKLMSWVILKRLERQVVIADCMCCNALLTFVKNNWTSFVRGSWILRKAWKVYDKTYSEIRWLYTQKFSCDILGDTTQSEVTSNIDASLCDEDFQIDDVCINEDCDGLEDDNMNADVELPFFPSQYEEIAPDENGRQLIHIDETDELSDRRNYEETTEGETYAQILPPAANDSIFPTLVDADVISVMSDKMVSRLMASVCFGYGIFQLCSSLLPPSLMKISQFLGFEVNRNVGLSALQFSRMSDDMRAPLATLSLLWYHTVIRPFFSLDGNNVRAGVQEAQNLLDESKDEFSSSALFLFFQGLLHRLNNNLASAMLVYNSAIQLTDQREVKLICLHEIGWCHMLQLNFGEALNAFQFIRDKARWSVAFYAYLVALCKGSMNNLKDCRNSMKDVPSLIKAKDNHFEAFVKKKSKKIGGDRRLLSESCMLYVMEVIFLWNLFPSFNEENLQSILKICDVTDEKYLLALKCLIEGAAYKQLNNQSMAVQCLEECLARSLGNNDDLHVPAYASYELGLILMTNTEEYAKAESCFNDAKNKFKGCHFEERLIVKVHAALKMLKSTQS